MDRRIIDDHARFLGDCLAKDLETTDNDFRRYRLVHTERGQVVLGGKKPDLRGFVWVDIGISG